MPYEGQKGVCGRHSRVICMQLFSEELPQKPERQLCLPHTQHRTEVAPEHHTVKKETPQSSCNDPYFIDEDPETQRQEGQTLLELSRN